MPKASPFPSNTPAAQAVQSCPKPVATSAPLTSGATVAPVQKPTKPCDIKTITLSLTSDGKTITKTGSINKASAPLPGVSDQINELLGKNAVVIHRAIPTAIMTNQSTRAGITPELPVSGKAKASAVMKSTCGQHPTFTETPEPDTPQKSGALSVSTTTWQVADFGKMVFQGKSMRDLFYGDRSAVTFTATSCGAPAQGNATTSLQAVAQVAIADEWDIKLVSGTGIEIKLSTSATATRENSYGSGYRGTSTGTSSQIKGSIDSVGYSRSGNLKVSAEQDDYNRTQNLGGGYQLDTQYRSNSLEVSSKSTSEDVFFADGSRKILADAKESFTVDIKRNGASYFSFDEIIEALEQFGEALGEVFERVGRLKTLFERGAKLAFPMSLSFDLAFALTLMKGSISGRIWPGERRVLEGGTYYIEDRNSKFSLIVDLLVAELKVEPKIEAQASVFSKYVASITLTISGSVAGSASLNFRVDYATTSYIVQAVGHIPMSIAAEATGSAAGFYVMAQGKMQSALNYTWTAEYRPLELSKAQHNLTNEQLACELVVKRGNKLLEWFGVTEEKEWFKWPKDGPFIWIETGAMNQSW